MSKKASRIVALITASVLSISLLGGCGQSSNNSSQSTASQSASSTSSATDKSSDVAYQPWADGSVKDTSDLPTWTGKKLNLRVWYAHGTQGIPKQKSVNDVVLPEIERVTGVHIDIDNSFDNGGQTYDVKLGMLVAANDLPDIMVEGNPSKLYDAQKSYGISQDMLQKYAPTALKKIDQKDFAPSWNMLQAKDGNYFALPTEVSEKYVYEKDSTVNKTKYAYYYPPRDNLPCVVVRDDILKKAYPNAYTQKDLEDLFVKQNGTLTKEQLLDIPINSTDDFFTFLRNIDSTIKKDNIKEGNKQVQTIGLFSGADNWALLSNLGSGLVGGDSSDWNYMSYFDKSTQHVEWGYKQPFFKDLLQKFNQLAIDGVASKEAFVDSNAAYMEKLNNGLYAVTYAWLWPDLNAIKSANKPYTYRKVYMNIPKASNIPEIDGTYKANQNITILKNDNIKEEDIPQILRYYDYSMSDVAEKLWSWGPKSAGLFTEDSNGNRQYKDKDLEAYMVYNNQNGSGKQKCIDYNLDSGMLGDYNEAGTFALTYANWGRSKYNAAVTYDRVPDPNAEYSFSSGMLFPVTMANVAVTPDFWNYTNYVDGAKKINASTKVFNDALLKVLASSNASQFEDHYKSLLDLDAKIGTTKDTLDQMDAKFKELNKDYMQNLK